MPQDAVIYALLELDCTLARLTRAPATDLGREVKGKISALRRAVLRSDGPDDPRSLLDLAIRHCRREGVPTQDIAAVISAHGLQPKSAPLPSPAPTAPRLPYADD